MKKVFIATIIFLCFAPLLTKASSVQSVKITETTPVFESNKKVGVFQKGTLHAAFKESDRFYHTVIGNEEVTFSKKRAVLVQKDPPNLKAAHPVRIRTKKAAVILDRPSITAKKMGELRPQVIVHAQRLKGQYYPLLIGGVTGYIHKNDVQVETGLPVLMYHDIVRSKAGDNASKLEYAKFKEQMEYLDRNNWTTVSLQDVEQYVLGNITLPEKSVLITFDDGYQSILDYAYPLLKQYDFQAVSFLITSRIDKPEMIASSNLIRTQDVFSYQNHTHKFHLFNSKTNLSFLQSESQDAIYNDLVTANEFIETVLQKESSVTSFAYPYGKRSPQAIQALQFAGITSAYTIEEGNVFPGDSLYALKRQRVHSQMTLQDFAAKLQGK